MKYGESLFDILYLLFAIVSGCILLVRARNKNEKKMGIAVLILGIGDAFHLIPRVLNYFITDVDLTPFLGIGKLITSITMTFFYVLLYQIWIGYWHEETDIRLTKAVWILTAARILICLLPHNQWLSNESTVVWGIVRNIPFLFLGLLTIILYQKKSGEKTRLQRMWLLITMSFLFYLPAAVAAGILPALGMLMLPKTICYILMVWLFLQAVLKDAPR